MGKTALIIGVTGQDGSYLAELLLSKGYEVHGLMRRTSFDNTARLGPVLNDITLHEGDLADGGALLRVITKTQPDEIYNLGAQSHVHTSFAEAEHTAQINGLGVVRLLEILRSVDVKRKIRFYQASTSELFGNADAETLNEDSPMQPVSPYGAAKLYAYHMVRMYRDAYGMFACNGILFNHESPRRGERFVTSKIANFVSGFENWNGEPLMLGNLNAKRDWGFAGDYVDGMWRMLQSDTPDDYILATGQAHSVRSFVESAFGIIDRKITWQGEGADETGILDDGRVVIRIDQKLFRPVDIHCLIGDASKAKEKLGWTPSLSFNDLVHLMIK